MPQSTPIELPFAQRERFRFMEATLLWEGNIQRARISDVFDVAVNHVTTMFRDYEATYPNSLVFEPRRRAYVPGPRFKPRFASEDPAEYLALQLAFAESGSEAVVPLLSGGTAVPTMTLPSPAHGINRAVLQAVVQAIRSSHGLEILYHSMRAERPARRAIWPHALVHTGVRWHARAFDGQSGEFRQFVLQRMDAPKALAEGAPEPAGKDLDWSTFATLEVIPHPDLNPHQQRVVAREFGMRTTKSGGPAWSVRLRRCLIGYFAQRYALDVAAPRLPQHRIVLRNPANYREWFLPSGAS